MTVASTGSRVQYNGNGVTANFAIPFKYFAKADIDVILTSAAGVDSVKTESTHFSMTGPGDTGTVTFFSTPPNDHRPQTGEVATIRRIMALTQSTDYIPGGGISTGTIEATDDRQLMQIQQMQEQINRAPLLKSTSTEGPVTLPEPVASKYLAWNTGGTDLENVDAGPAGPTGPQGPPGQDGAGTGDVTGPASATDDRLAAFDGTTGKLIKDSGVLISDVLTAAAADALFLTPTEGDSAYEPLDADILKADVTDTLTAGFNATEFDAGTKTTGTFTPDPASGNFQKAVNGGAHTLAPPGSTCSIVLQYTNDGSAGAITTSGFTKVSGDAFTTTSGHDFMCYLVRNNGFSHLNVVALQ